MKLSSVWHCDEGFFFLFLLKKKNLVSSENNVTFSRCNSAAIKCDDRFLQTYNIMFVPLRLSIIAIARKLRRRIFILAATMNYTDDLALPDGRGLCWVSLPLARTHAIAFCYPFWTESRRRRLGAVVRSCK